MSDDSLHNATNGSGHAASEFGKPNETASHEDIILSLIQSNGRTAEWRKHFDDRVAALERTSIDILAELKSNTEETKLSREAVEAVRDGMTTLRVVRRVIVWVGGIAAAVSATWALWVQARGGKP